MSTQNCTETLAALPKRRASIAAGSDPAVLYMLMLLVLAVGQVIA